MTLPRLIFRADGDAQTGLGHVMRCLALADMLRVDFDCQFVCYQPLPGLKALFQQKRLPLTALQTQELPEFMSVIQPDDLVVLDGYLFDEAVQRSVRSIAKRLVFVDDLLRGHQVADLIINHTAGIAAADYVAESYTRFLLGPAYALVNPLFRASEPSAANPTIFVNLGGADPMNVSHQIVTQLVAHQAGRPVRVVLGGANQHQESFAGFSAGQVTVLSNLSVADMADEIAQCGLAIVSCSTISYEVATVGRPFIGVLTADNQRRLAHFLAQEVAIGVLTLPLDPGHLSLLIEQATPDQGVANQRRYLDGRTAGRYRDAFRSLLFP